jgi:hypothetical protein
MQTKKWAVSPPLQHGTRQMIELLSLGTGEVWDRLRAAVEEALPVGCQDVAAIRHLLFVGRLTKPAVAAIEVGVLSRYERPGKNRTLEPGFLKAVSFG